jgi:hypothetical protein
VSATDRTSIVEVLRSDHASIAGLLAGPDATAATEAGAAHREQLVMELVRHFVAVEQYLFPTVREHVPDASSAADEAFTRDRSLEKRLRALEDPDLAPTELAALWTELGTAFAGHERSEESLFAAVDAACSPQLLAELGEDALGAEQVAPTRPRSIAPHAPGVNKFTSVVAGFVDQVRDHYSRRGVDPAHEPPD